MSLRSQAKITCGGLCHRFPRVNFISVESGIGWIPYLLERADYANEQHSAWTHSSAYLQGKKPSDVYREHFYSCFIDDAFGIEKRAGVARHGVISIPSNATSQPAARTARRSSLGARMGSPAGEITLLTPQSDVRTLRRRGPGSDLEGPAVGVAVDLHATVGQCHGNDDDAAGHLVVGRRSGHRQRDGADTDDGVGRDLAVFYSTRLDGTEQRWVGQWNPRGGRFTFRAIQDSEEGEIVEATGDPPAPVTVSVITLPRSSAAPGGKSRCPPARRCWRHRRRRSRRQRRSGKSGCL